MECRKRKHITITLGDKRGIIEALENGTRTTAMLGKYYNIHETTVRRIFGGKEKINSAFENAPEGTSLASRKSLRESRHPQLEQVLFAWVLQERERNHILTCDILKEKAKIFYTRMVEICGEVFAQFNASNGWFCNFRTRFGLKMLTLTGEKVSADDASFQEFKVRKTNQ